MSSTPIASTTCGFLQLHGFRKHLSCETHLFELVADQHNSLDDSYSADAILIDFANAFDTVPHQRLLLELSQLSIDTTVINCIASFLDNRGQSVPIDDISSRPTSVKSGMPKIPYCFPFM